MLRKVLVNFVIVFVLAMGFPGFVMAATTDSILPATEKTVLDCKQVMNYVSGHRVAIRDEFAKRNDQPFALGEGNEGTVIDVLGCGIKTGQIRLWMIPYYIRYILEFVIQIGGLVAVGGIIYGGYLYLFAGVSEDKDKGKKAIMYSVAGIVVSLLAWAFVNILIAVVTA